jgi:hypothetical protein
MSCGLQGCSSAPALPPGAGWPQALPSPASLMRTPHAPPHLLPWQHPPVHGPPACLAVCPSTSTFNPCHNHPRRRSAVVCALTNAHLYRARLHVLRSAHPLAHVALAKFTHAEALQLFVHRPTPTCTGPVCMSCGLPFYKHMWPLPQSPPSSSAVVFAQT